MSSVKMHNIVLIGMPNCGKSSLGRRTAESLGLEFLDTDILITEQTGRSIPDIFARDGEPFFRDLETSVLTAIHSVKPGGLVLAVGGGMPLRPENVRLMREIGLVVFIDRPLELLENNVSFQGDRPLLSDTERLRRMYEQRRPVYLSAADVICENTGSYMSVLNKLGMITELSGAAASYCVIGDPIAHSKSPLLHAAVFEHMKIDEKYIAVRVPPEHIELARQTIKAGTIKGLNVTKPHKESIISILDELIGDAKDAGAVNTVVRKNDNGSRIKSGMTMPFSHSLSLIGYNTDMEGLRLAVERNGRTYKGSRIVVLGTGGAAMGVCHKAAACGAVRVLLIGRNGEKAKAIAAAAGGSAEAAAVNDYAEIGELIEDADILINATPLGMEGIMDEFRSFDFLESLKEGALVYDLVYDPAETNLIKQAKKRGLDTDNGLSMLIYQGIISEELFFKRPADRDALFDMLYRVLANKDL
jgi:shikimate dehydrogenase